MSSHADVWDGLTPEDLIEKMFERTDADGVLYMRSFFPGSLYSMEDESLRCVMRWEFPSDCFAVLQEFDHLREALELLAEKDLESWQYDACPDEWSEEEKEIWRLYLRPFASDAQFDGDRIYEIGERLDVIAEVRKICRKIGIGKQTDPYSEDFLRENLSETVTAEEEAYYDRFQNERIAECRNRLGDHPFAYRTILHARRYHRLACLKAPDLIMANEGRALASALTLFRQCRKYESVDNAVRSHFDRLELMSDEELDALHRPRKNANSRKSLLPLFVYLILKQHSDSEHPLRQQDILAYLADDPYEIIVERKALSRVISNLKSSQLGICTDKHRGSWIMGSGLHEP